MNLLCIENFSGETLSQVIRDLQFKDKDLGQEIDCFNFVDPTYEEIFSGILRQKVSLPKDWGFFRKANSTIHFENHSGRSLFAAVLALDDLIFATYKHKKLGAKTVYCLLPESVPTFVQENCNVPENWDVENRIAIPQGSLFFYEPWYWHTFSNGIAQHFLVERPSETNKIDETPKA